MTRQGRALFVVLLLAFVLIVTAPEVHRVKATEPWRWDDARAVICAPQYTWDCDVAMYTVYRESRFVATAYNAGCGCAGWWQIASIHGHPLSTLFDPEANTAIAYELWRSQGWAPWRVN